MPNPFKNVMNIKRRELPLALLMFSYFFLVITSFWILKPIKKALFITHYHESGFNFLGWMFTASQAELLAKILNMFVAFIAVMVFTWLARKFRRQQLTYIFSTFFLGCYALYAFLLRQNGGGLSIWSFYLFGDLFSTLMVATFFAFINDSVTPEKAKRIYGLVGLGGVGGGFFGTTVLRVWINSLSYSQWLFVCFGIGILIIIVAYFAGKITDSESPSSSLKTGQVKKPSKPDTSVALEGAKLVFKSPYLLSIVAIVGLYEIASTVMDFQFTATVAHYVPSDKIGEHFATIFMITNIISLTVQFLFTSFIMTRFGLTIALAILPIAILFGSAGFLVFPVLWLGSFLNTADNGFSYSINQSAKETLYVPTTKDEKYKAKAFIDMFVQRFAKAIAVGVSLLITSISSDFSSVRWLSLFTFIIVIIWLFAVRYAGKKFSELSSHK